MAIDTAAKRFSMLHVITGSQVPLPYPDGSVGEGDRYHFLRIYSGITLDAPGSPTETILDYERGIARGVMRGVSRGIN